MVETAKTRRAARVLVIDDSARILLLKARRPDDGGIFWLAPGGGLQDNESFAAAAQRELAEETSLVVELGPWVWERRHLHTWSGRARDQYERFFVARTDKTEVLPVKPDGYISGHRWWTISELQEATDEFTPRRLPELLPPLLHGQYPPSPIDCGV